MRGALHGLLQPVQVLGARDLDHTKPLRVRVGDLDRSIAFYTDVLGMRTTAARRGDRYVLNGAKMWITNGVVTDAELGDVFLVYARVEGAERSRLTMFIVEKGFKGFALGQKIHGKLGMRASDTASVVFSDCLVPAENMVGNRGEGFIDAMKVLDGGRISIAALSVGCAQGAYEAAIRYSKEREQFGKPISSFQGIQFKLADMATEIEAARLLTYQAAAMKDAGKNVTKQSAMAKLYASEVSVRVSEEAIQIHGGYGYIKDYPVEKFWRDSKLLTIGEGTSEIQRIVIAKRVLSHG